MTAQSTEAQDKSAALFARAVELMPGGVNSPVRAFRGVGGTPRFIRSAKGATMTDVDGRTYIDYVGSWGPMILGHADEEVLNALTEALARGTSYGAPTELELEVAEEIIDAVPSIEMVREITTRHSALLIFDEVMTGFRLARGGAQELYNVRPDITTLGKIIGGGLPVGAYGASREIMNHIAPAGNIYQAGTLSGNPLAMTAGLVTLKRLRDAAVYKQLERAGQRLCDGLSKAAREAGIETVTNRVGSMWTTFFTNEPVTDWTSAARSNRELFGKFFHAMLDEGVYLAPSQFEAGFIGLAHTDELLYRTVEAARRALKTIVREK